MQKYPSSLNRIRKNYTPFSENAQLITLSRFESVLVAFYRPKSFVDLLATGETAVLKPSLDRLAPIAASPQHLPVKQRQKDSDTIECPRLHN